MADDVVVQIGAKIDQLVSGVNEAKSKIKEIASSSMEVADSFTHLKELALAWLSVEGIKSFIESMGALGLQVERVSAQLGLNSSEVVQLGGMAQLTGGSIEGLALSVERMSLNIQKSTRDAFNPAAEGLRVLGLNAKDLIGLPAAQYFDKLQEAVSKFNPSLEVTNAVMAVGGRGIQQLLPLLLLSRDEYLEMKEAVDQSTRSFQDAAPGMAQTHQKLTLLSLAAQDFGVRIFDIMKPAVDKAADAIRQWILTLDADTVRSVMVQIVDVTGFAMEKMADIFQNLTTWISQSVAEMKTLALIAGVTGAAILFAMNPIAGSIAAIGAAAAYVTLQMKTGADETVAAVTPWGQKIKEITADMHDLINATAHEAAGLPELQEEIRRTGEAMNTMGKQQLAAAMKGFDEEIKMAGLNYQTQVNLGEQAVFNRRMTEGQKVAAVGAAHQQMYAIQIDALQRELALNGLSLEQKKEFENKITTLTKEASNDRIKIETDTQKANVGAWQEALGDITTAFDSQLKGLLFQHKSWKVAMVEIYQDLAVQIIKELEKILIKELAIAAVRVGLNIATGGVGGSLLGMFKFQEGTPYVPETGLALMHKGEMVIPANVAEMVRSGRSSVGTGGGGNAVTLNLSVATLDTSTMASWLRGPGGQMIANSVSKMWSNNPTMRPAY